MQKLIFIFILFAGFVEQVFLETIQFNDYFNNEEVITKSLMSPAIVNPINYNLSLTFHLNDNSEKFFIFEGIVEIKMEVKEPVQHIILNSENLKFDRENCTLKTENGAIITDYILNFDKNGKFNISMKNDKILPSGLYLLKIYYTGMVRDDYKGVFIQSYENEKEDKVWYLATQLQPSYARRLLPCFDHPSYKATFDVTIRHSKKYKALSSTQAKRTFLTNSIMITTFETTPPMPTHLLAIFVSDFKFKNNTANNFRIHAPESKINYTQFALDKGIKVWNKYNELFNATLDMNKLDMVILPNNLSAAIENFGLIIFGQNHALFDETLQTTTEKHNIAIKIAHELGHQWFRQTGNFNFWKNSWDKEGIINFLSYYIMDKLEPTWRLMDRFVVHDMLKSAFEYDSTLTTVPLSQQIFSDLKHFFQPIVYTKGTAIFRMMQHIFPERLFWKILENHLIQTYNKTADLEDLFRDLQEVADAEKINIKIKNILDPWINIKGYPILTVIRNYESQTAELKQKPFFTNNGSKGIEKNLVNWHIPINYAIAKKLDFDVAEPKHWLSETSMTITIDADPEDWCIFNKQVTGYYRVNYDEKNWRLIIKYLKSNNRKKIHVLNRAQLMSDALVFVQQKLLSIDILLTLTSYLEYETNYIAWLPGFDALEWINSKLIGTPHHSIYIDYVSKLTQCAIESVGFEDTDKDDDIIKLFRTALIKLSCSMGNSMCINKMHTLLIKWLDDPQKNIVSADMKKLVLCYGLKEANYSTWKKTINIGKKLSLKEGLECSGNVDILQMYFNDMSPRTEQKLSINDKISILNKLPKTKNEDLKLIFDLTDIVTSSPEYNSTGANYLSYVILRLSSKLTTETYLKKMEKPKYIKTFASSVVNSAKKNIKTNIQWFKDNVITLFNTFMRIDSTLKSFAKDCL